MRRPPFIAATSLLAILLAFAACERADTPARDAEEHPEATFEQTIAALERGSLSYPPSAWVANIDGWLDRLATADVPNRDEIEDALRSLRSEIQRVPLDVGRVAELMEELGNWASGAAEATGDPRADELAAALSREAERIRVEVAGPEGLPARPARPGAPGAVEQEPIE